MIVNKKIYCIKYLVIRLFYWTTIHKNRFDESVQHFNEITLTNPDDTDISLAKTLVDPDAPLSQQVSSFTGSKQKCHRLRMRDLGSPILNFAFYLFHTLSVAIWEKVKLILCFAGTWLADAVW